MKIGKITRFGILVVAAAVLLAFATITTPAQAGNDALHQIVCSDGSEIFPLEAAPSAKLKGEDPFVPEGEFTAEALLSEGVTGLATKADAKAILELEPATAEVGIETVLGLDTRLRVYPNRFPARATALITFTGGRCTGWMYGSNVAATAGHCVHTGGPGGAWRTNVRVYPGYNGAGSPYCTARWLGSVVGWTNSSDERYDYGVVKLNCTIGNTTGWFGYWWQAAALTNLPSVINGYPGDKPQAEQWLGVDQVRVTQERQVFYKNDTFGGMSGSPVWYDRPAGSAFCANGPCAYAIHAYGLHGAAPHSTHNHGTRITEAVYNNLNAWKNAP